MAVHLARSSSVREMSTEDFQRQMFQKRNLFSLGNLPLKVNNREETKSKSNTTARKSTHVLKTPPKFTPQKNQVHTNSQENNASVTRSFASGSSTDSSYFHNQSRNCNGASGISDSSNTSSPTNTQSLTNYVGKKRGRKRTDANRRHLKLQNTKCTLGTSAHDGPITSAIPDNNSVDNGVSSSTKNTWNLSIKQTIQEVKGVLGLMLKMKNVQSSNFFRSVSDNRTLNNKRFQSSGKAASPDNTISMVHDKPSVSKSHSHHPLEDSHLKSLHIDCTVGQSASPLSCQNENESFTSELSSSSTEVLDSDLLHEEDGSCMLTSPSTVDSPTVTVASHITSEEAESEEQLQLWLDDSSGDGMNLNTAATEKHDTKFSSPGKLLKTAAKTVPKKVKEPTDDVPLLLSVYSETSPVEQPRSPEMPVLKPVTLTQTDVESSSVDVTQCSASICNTTTTYTNSVSRRKLPKIVLEPLSADLVKKLNSGPVNCASLEVSQLLHSFPPKLIKKPEPRRNLFTIFTSSMSKLHNVQLGKTEKVPPFCTDLLVIDGLEFYSFETLEALNEYTEHELRKKQELQSLCRYDTQEDLTEVNDEDLKDVTDSGKYSCTCIKPIIPTKTDDITKIKGWRNKLFAAETTQTVTNNLPDPEDIKKYHWTKRIELCKHLSHSERKRAGLLDLVKRRRLRLTANKFTKKKIHMKQLKGPLTAETPKEAAGINGTENTCNIDNTQKNVQEHTVKDSSIALARESNISSHKQNSAFESEFLEEFLKSRSRLTTQRDLSSLSTDIQASNDKDSSSNQKPEAIDGRQKIIFKGSLTNHSVSDLNSGTLHKMSKKKRGRPKNMISDTKVYLKKIDGTPFKTPYGLYQFFETVFLPVGSVQDNKPSFFPCPTNQRLIEPPSIVSADVAKVAVSAIPEQFSFVNESNKSEHVDLTKHSSFNRDRAAAVNSCQPAVYDKRSLTANGVMVPETLVSPHYTQASSEDVSSMESKCKELFCRFGCVCDSLKVRKRKRGHCGKEACMFTCVCSNAELIEGGQAELPVGSTIRPEIMTDDGPVKRRRATRLPAKLMDSAFVWHQGKELLIDPELSPSFRAGGRKSKMLVKAKLKVSPEKPKITNRIRYDYSVSTNRPIAPKIPPIRITNIKAKTSYPVISPVPPTPCTINSKPEETLVQKPRVFAQMGKVQPTSQPMLPLGPSCVNGNMIVDPIIHGYLARALICIAHSPGGGSCLKFIGVTAVPQSKEQRDAVVMQLCNSKENSVAFTRIGQSQQIATEHNKAGMEESSTVSDINQTSDKPNNVTHDEKQLSKIPSAVRLHVDGGAVICPPGSPQVLFPQVLSTVSVCKKNFMVTGYLVSKCNLKEAAVRANTSGAVVSVPIRIVRGQFVPFSQSNSIADLAKPAFGAYAIQNLTSHVFVGPFNLTLHSKHKASVVQTSNSHQQQSIVNPISSFRGLIPVKRGASFAPSISSEKRKSAGTNALQFGLNRQDGATVKSFSQAPPGKIQVRWNVASEEVESLMSDLLAEVCAGEEQEPNYATNLTRVVICGSTIRSASINSDRHPNEVSKNPVQLTLAPEYVSEYKNSTVPVIVDENPQNSISQYKSLCKPVKVVLEKLEQPSPVIPQHRTTISGDKVETVMDSPRSTESSQPIHSGVRWQEWKKCLQEKSDRTDKRRELSRTASKERVRRREQRGNLRRLALVLDPTNKKALQKASKYPSLISLLSQARLCVRELESHCRNIEEFKKVLINRRLHLFTQYTRLLKELPDAVQKEAVQKLTVRLQACCQVRDQRKKVQTTWEPELDKKDEDFDSENGNAYSDDHTTTGSESASSSSTSDSDETNYLDVETVSDDESSEERSGHNSHQNLQPLQDFSKSTSPLPDHGIKSQEHINRTLSPRQHTTTKMQFVSTATNTVDVDQSATRVQESLVSKNMPSATDAAYYCALSSILSDHANYTAKVLPVAPGSAEHTDDTIIQEDYSDQAAINNISCNSQVSSGGCDGNIHNEVVCLDDDSCSVNTSHNTFDFADQSAVNTSVQTIQENGEILEITISNEDIGALNSGLDIIQNSVQYGTYPMSASSECFSQVNSTLDSSIIDVKSYYASESIHQNDDVCVSPELSTVGSAHNNSDSECGSVTDDITINSSEMALPLEDVNTDDVFEDLPKIIACSSITEAEFFAEGDS